MLRCLTGIASDEKASVVWPGVICRCYVLWWISCTTNNRAFELFNSALSNTVSCNPKCLDTDVDNQMCPLCPIVAEIRSVQMQCKITLIMLWLHITAVNSNILFLFLWYFHHWRLMGIFPPDIWFKYCNLTKALKARNLCYCEEKLHNTPGENNHTTGAYVSKAKKQAEGYPKAFCKPFGDFSWPQTSLIRQLLESLTPMPELRLSAGPWILFLIWERKCILLVIKWINSFFCKLTVMHAK